MSTLVVTVMMGCLLLGTFGCLGDEELGPGCDSAAIDWTVWVANQGEGIDTVTVFRNHGDDEQVTAEILKVIPVERAPHNLSFSPDGSRAYVACLGDGTSPGNVTVIDTTTLEVITSVPAGVKTHDMTATPDGKWIWAVNVTDDNITIINADTLVAEPDPIAVGDGPAHVAFLSDGSKAYVSNGNEGTMSVVDVATRTVVKTITTGLGSMGLQVDQDDRFVFETEGSVDRVSVIDTVTDEVTSVITFDETLTEPHHLGLAGWDLLITNRGGDSLSFVDTRTLEQTGAISVPGRPDIIAVSPNCHRAYLTLRDVVGVAVVDLVDMTYLDVIGFEQGELHGIALLPGAEASPSPMLHQKEVHDE